jgi:DNA-binding response OmpR family regulator
MSGLSMSRDRHAPNRVICLGPVAIDLDLYVARVAGLAVNLTQLEFGLLVYIMERANRVVSREELVEQVIRGTWRSETTLVRVHVAHLRRKLGPNSDVIETVRGRGIRFRPTREQQELSANLTLRGRNG